MWACVKCLCRRPPTTRCAHSLICTPPRLPKAQVLVPSEFTCQSDTSSACLDTNFAVMTVEAKCLVDPRTEPVGIRARSKQSTRDFPRFASAHRDGLVGRLIQFAEIFGGYEDARRRIQLLLVPSQCKVGSHGWSENAAIGRLRAQIKSPR